MARRMLVLVVAMMIGAEPLLAQEEPDPKKKRAEELAVQRKQADELWQKLLSGRPFAHRETENFLIYGTINERDLETVSRVAEEWLPAIKKKVQAGPKDELWPGKLVIHAFGERGQFATYIRQTEKRSPEDDETGSYENKSDVSFVVVGPPARGMRPLDNEVVRQLAAATLTKKAGKLPEWFVNGFARSIAYRHRPAQFAAERTKAAALVRQGKTGKDVWTSMNLATEEAMILQGSLLDYLVHGPMAKYFPDILNSMGEETPFDDALKAAKLEPDRVDFAWRRWAASGGK